jgi:hypothetical protein
MTWWSEMGDDRTPPFDVYLSVGLPGPIPDDTSGAVDDASERSNELTDWANALVSTARAVLSRGGRIIAGFDPDVTPVLAAVALEYSAGQGAEDVDDRDAAPVAIVVDPGTRTQLRHLRPEGPQVSFDPDVDADRGPDDDEEGDGWLGFLQSTMAVQFIDTDHLPDDRGRVPVRRVDGNVQLSFLLWPDDSCRVDLEASSRDRRALLLPSHGSIDDDWRGHVARTSEDVLLKLGDRKRSVDAVPYGFVVHRLIDDWVGPSQQQD